MSSNTSIRCDITVKAIGLSQDGQAKRCVMDILPTKRGLNDFHFVKRALGVNRPLSVLGRDVVTRVIPIALRVEAFGVPHKLCIIFVTLGFV